MIECKICHKSFKSLSRTHLYYKHSLTQAEYLKDFKIRTIISPETKQLLSKIHMGNTNNVGRKHTPDEIKKNSERGKKRWKNPQFRKNFVRAIKKAWKTGKIREAVTGNLKQKWADPAYRAKMSEMSKKTWRRRDYRQRHNRMMKKLWKTPSFLRKMAKRKIMGVKSPLSEEQWEEVVGWLVVSPREFGLEAPNWNLKEVRDLIVKKWGVQFHEASIGWQFRKRGCKRVPIGFGESSNSLNSRYKFQKWVGPEDTSPKTN